MKLFRSVTLSRVFPWILIIVGIIGLLCSFILTVDKMQVLRDPSFKPPCNLNPVISCGSVMGSAQSAALGFENTFLGLAGFAVIVTTGVVLLAGARLKRWYWLGLQAGMLLGVLFVHWLIFNSLYRIGSLCPYCMVTWVIVITGFWYTTLYNIQEKHLLLKGRLVTAASFARRHHVDILLLWFLVILALILKRFWYYYGPMLGF
jgi:uncharacterized membrane protein